MFDIPTVLTAEELLDAGFRRASKVSGAGKDRLRRTRDETRKRLKTLSAYVDSTLYRYVKGFPSFQNLPPFYRVLADIVVGEDEARHHLGALNWCRREVQRIAKDTARRVSRERDKRDIDALRKEAYGRISSLVKQVADSLEFLGTARNELRGVPTIDPHLPTLVVAGGANVGKSTLVKAISSARPAVASYPFTTTEISVGHFEANGTRYQVVDTPGLLDRPMAERNDIERQTINALEHLADVIIFLLDPSETCGYPLEEQVNLMREIRAAFPHIPFQTAENKGDLCTTRSPRLRISATTGDGVEELVRRAVDQARQVKA